MPFRTTSVDYTISAKYMFEHKEWSMKYEIIYEDAGLLVKFFQRKDILEVLQTE